jgi:hypothetical protein
VKKPLLAVGTLLLVAVAAWGSPGSFDPAEQASPMRTLQGFVLGSGDSPLSDAIVYLKNTKTLSVKTFISERDGTYRFNALSPNVDYEVYAEYKGKKSGTKTVSSFDSRKQVTINLRIDTN